MKENIYRAFMFLLAVILQTTLLARLQLPAWPNLPLLLVCIFALLRGMKHGFVWGFVAGFLFDLYALGTYIFTFPLIGLCVGFLESKIFKNNMLFPPLILMGASFLNNILTYVIAEDLLFNLSCRAVFLKILLPAALVDGLLGGIIYFILFIFEDFLFEEFKGGSCVFRKNI